MKAGALAVVPQSAKEPTRVLLVQRKDVPVWVLPGGGVEAGESPLEAAARETFEESGVRVTGVQLIATYHPANKLAATTYLVRCAPVQDATAPFSCDAETADAAFFDVNDLPALFFPIHKGFLSEWRSSTPKPIERKLLEISYGALCRYFLRHPYLVGRYLLTRFFA